jgi:hypothetical protein
MKLNAEQLMLAKEWLCELSWTNVTSKQIWKMSDVCIEQAIKQHYGSLKMFITEYCQLPNQDKAA